MARDAIIHRAKPYLLHGEQYYEILYSYTNEPDTLRQSRTAHDYIYPNPQEGDHVLIEAVLQRHHRDRAEGMTRYPSDNAFGGA